jgi:hypothetical protein
MPKDKVKSEGDLRVDGPWQGLPFYVVGAG